MSKKNDPIIPGKSLGGFMIGDKNSDLRSSGMSIEVGDNEFYGGSVSVYVGEKTEAIELIVANFEYEGLLFDKIKCGDQIGKVLNMGYDLRVDKNDEVIEFADFRCVGLRVDYNIENVIQIDELRREEVDGISIWTSDYD